MIVGSWPQVKVHLLWSVLIEQSTSVDAWYSGSELHFCSAAAYRTISTHGPITLSSNKHKYKMLLRWSQAHGQYRFLHWSVTLLHMLLYTYLYSSNIFFFHRSCFSGTWIALENTHFSNVWLGELCLTIKPTSHWCWPAVQRWESVWSSVCSVLFHMDKNMSIFQRCSISEIFQPEYCRCIIIIPIGLYKQYHIFSCSLSIQHDIWIGLN